VLMRMATVRNWSSYSRRWGVEVSAHDEWKMAPCGCAGEQRQRDRDGDNR